MFFKAKLTRYNLENREIDFDSREYGYLVLILEYFEIPSIGVGHSKTRFENATLEDDKKRWIESDGGERSEVAQMKRVVPPVRIRFVPDPKLSVNQIMEFKKLHTEMRMYLSRNQADGCLKLVYEAGRLHFSICHYTSEMTVPIESEHFPTIIEILDQICIVVSTNTFFQLELKDITQTGTKHYQEWRNCLLTYFK